MTTNYNIGLGYPFFSWQKTKIINQKDKDTWKLKRKSDREDKNDIQVL